MPNAIVISARRSALGRVGGLHRSRRVEDLAQPVISAALADAGCLASEVGGLIVGNASAGNNVARVTALTAGLPETAFSLTLDSQCASGIDAILDAIRRVTVGEADIVVAGGAESPSTAPWRIARPKNPYQIPHFLGLHPQGADIGYDHFPFEADELLARRNATTRAAQDAYVLQSLQAAQSARDRRQFIGEIVGQRASPEELRDQIASELNVDELPELEPFQADQGTLTTGNTSPLADGAAFVVVVSGRTWQRLGKPTGLMLQRSHVCGVTATAHAAAAAVALEALLQRGTDRAARDIAQIGAIEINETSAVEGIGFAKAFKLSDGILNAGGGAIVRGTAIGAAGAISLIRLFSRMIRTDKPAGRTGAVAQRAAGGLGVAAIFAVAE